MGRANWKGSFVEKFALNKFNVKSKGETFRVWSRRSVIPSNFVSKKIFVYTGNSFKPVFITRDKIGFKFGEFCLTRNRRIKKKEKKKEKKKK